MYKQCTALTIHCWYTKTLQHTINQKNKYMFLIKGRTTCYELRLTWLNIRVQYKYLKYAKQTEPVGSSASITTINGLLSAFTLRNRSQRATTQTRAIYSECITSQICAFVPIQSLKLMFERTYTAISIILRNSVWILPTLLVHSYLELL